MIKKETPPEDFGASHCSSKPHARQLRCWVRIVAGVFTGMLPVWPRFALPDSPATVFPIRDCFWASLS